MADKELENIGENKVPDYTELVEELPERKVSLEELPKTLSEVEDTTPQTSDIKAILKTLTPKFKHPRINELCQSAMVSRIFVDNYTDKHFLITASLIEECEPDEDIDVIAIISQVQDALSIGYEGRGIVDRLELAGVAHEQEMEQLSKKLGLD